MAQVRSSAGDSGWGGRTGDGGGGEATGAGATGSIGEVGIFVGMAYSYQILDGRSNISFKI